MIPIIEYLSRQSRSFIIRIGLVLVLAIGVADFLTGSELSIFIFYLVPVFLITSLAGMGAGIFMAAASAFMWLIADLLAAREYAHPLIPYWNAFVRLAFLSIVAVLQNSLVREKHLARTDFLTGIANRKYGSAGAEINRSRRYELPFSVAYIDIDDFKTVNDHFGHDAGDRLLQIVADVLRKNVRTVDSAARLGGDEFALLLPQTGADSARSVLSKLHELLLDAVKKTNWPVTFSFGVVTFLKPPESVDEMIRKADGLMYAVKAEGKNAVKFDVYG